MPRHRKSEYLSSFRRLFAWDDYKANIEYRKQRRSCERRHVPFATNDSSSSSTDLEDDAVHHAMHSSANNALARKFSDSQYNSLTSAEHSDGEIYLKGRKSIHQRHPDFKSKFSDTVVDSFTSFPSMDCATFNPKLNKSQQSQKYRASSVAGDGRQSLLHSYDSLAGSGTCVKRTQNGTIIKEVNNSCGRPRLKLYIHGSKLNREAQDHVEKAIQMKRNSTTNPSRSVKNERESRVASAHLPVRRIFHPFGHADKEIPGSPTRQKRTFNVLADGNVHQTALRALERRHSIQNEKGKEKEFIRPSYPYLRNSSDFEIDNEIHVMSPKKFDDANRKESCSFENRRSKGKYRIDNSMNRNDCDNNNKPVDWCSEYQSRYPLYKTSHYESALKDLAQSHQIHLDRDLY